MVYFAFLSFNKKINGFPYYNKKNQDILSNVYKIVFRNYNHIKFTIMYLEITNGDSVGINLDGMHTEVRNFFPTRLA